MPLDQVIFSVCKDGLQNLQRHQDWFDKNDLVIAQVIKVMYQTKLHWEQNVK